MTFRAQARCWAQARPLPFLCHLGKPRTKAGGTPCQARLRGGPGEKGRTLCPNPGLADGPGAPRSSTSVWGELGWVSHRHDKRARGQPGDTERTQRPCSPRPVPGQASPGVSCSPRPHHTPLGAAARCPKIITLQPTICASLDQSLDAQRTEDKDRTDEWLAGPGRQPLPRTAQAHAQPPWAQPQARGSLPGTSGGQEKGGAPLRGAHVGGGSLGLPGLLGARVPRGVGRASTGGVKRADGEGEDEDAQATPVTQRRCVSGVVSCPPPSVPLCWPCPSGSEAWTPGARCSPSRLSARGGPAPLGPTWLPSAQRPLLVTRGHLSTY